MRNVFRALLILFIVSAAGGILPGCSGGDVVLFGDIIGPASVDENSSVEYYINPTSGSNAKFLWSCDPPYLGDFETFAFAKTAFTAGEVETDTPVKIIVVVNTDETGPVIKTKDIVIRNCEEQIQPNGWARTWGGYDECPGKDVAVDDAGNIYVAGAFYAGADFDPGEGVDYHSPHNMYDAFLSKFDPEGNFQWARTWGGKYFTGCNSVTVDQTGDIYVTGRFSDIVDFDPGPGIEEHKLHSGHLVDAFISKFDTAGNFEWARTWGGEGSDECYAITVDNSNMVYVTGAFRETVDFDPEESEDIHTAAGYYGYPDGFISKFDSAGNYIWVQIISGDESEVCRGIAVDGSGGVYVTGTFSDEIDFTPGIAGGDYEAWGAQATLVAKYDSNANFEWGFILFATTAVSGIGITADPNDNIYVTGSLWWKADFDPGPGEEIIDSYDDVYLAKYSSSGEYLWVRTWGSKEWGKSEDVGYSVAVDGMGNPYVTGYFQSTTDFDTGEDSEDIHAATAGEDAFLCKYDPDGNYLWTRTWGGIINDSGRAVAVDVSGNAYVTGIFSYTVDFHPGEGTEMHSSFGPDNAFLVKFDPEGNW